jgi:hypothetical protein
MSGTLYPYVRHAPICGLAARAAIVGSLPLCGCSSGLRSSARFVIVHGLHNTSGTLEGRPRRNAPPEAYVLQRVSSHGQTVKILVAMLEVDLRWGRLSEAAGVCGGRGG